MKLQHNSLFLKLALLLVVCFTLFNVGCTRIDAGHVGVVVNLAGSQKGVTDFTPTYGWVTYMPGKTSVFSFPTYVQNVTWTKSTDEGNPTDESITFTNKDKMSVNMDINLAYRLEPEKIPAFYVHFRTDDLKTFTDGFMRNVARDCINSVAGNYGIDDIMGDNAPFLKSSKECLQEHLGPYGVVIEQFGIIGAPRPPAVVLETINASAAAKQAAITSQNQVLQAQAEAQKQVATAKGNADAHSAQADGDAAYTMKLAKAQADANELVTRSLTPQLIEYTRVQNETAAINKWNGERPMIEGVGGGSGLLLNLGDLKK